MQCSRAQSGTEDLLAFHSVVHAGICIQADHEDDARGIPVLHARPQHPDCSVRPIRFILNACSRSLVLLLVFAAPATWACDDWLAKAVAITGAVERKSTAVDWQQLQVEQTVCPGDSVRVGQNSRAALYLRNNSFVRLDENSLLDFPAQQQERGFLLGLSQGFAHFISRIVNRFEVSTPYVNAVVEGTEFIVSASQAAAGVAVMEGKVKTYNDAGTETITSGQQVQATSRTASLTRINVPSASRVEWAIHYPPVLTLQNIQPVSAEEKSRLDALTPFLQQNRPDLALQSLEQNPAASPALDLARASLLLAVGRVDEFDALIPALLQGPQAGTAHALKAVADAARNRAEPALASAHKAVELAPQQAASHIALSYAQQASLQLDDALASAKKATDVEPANALAWLRLVELRLTQGDIGAAKKALAQIDKLPPEKQQPQVAILSAKGFVNLFSLKLKAARDNFQAALKQDSADPQNHLGLGLVLLRDGKLEEGRRQLEYAVSLDPLRSTLRSYLGRAYFEEKRDGEAIKQWDLAKQFDPNDPTPYFYTGVHKLFANDPIGAVDELEKSKELNDKRDIYRSETLLQSDAASRSSTLARAYDEVGYGQGVLLNGWDALRRDPTNSEGHRLLADKYADDPRYETARVSELMQSQLWQPLSAYPLQPQLAESNLAVVAGAGPQRPSFNEYHSLFIQDGVYGMANGYGGSDGIWGEDLVGSFLAGPVAMSLGQYHYESDGWRANSDQDQDVYNGFMQWQATPSTSLQLEGRKMEETSGDTGLTLLGPLDETLRKDISKESYRFGMKEALGNRDILLLSAAKLSLEDDQYLEPESDTELFVDSESDPETAELQYVHLAQQSHLVMGVGAYEDDLLVTNRGLLFGEEFLRQTFDQSSRHLNAYAYYSATHWDRVTLDAGLAYDQTRQDVDEVVEVFGFPEATSSATKNDKWSPKVGGSYRFSADWVMRAAAFRTYQRNLAYIQSIEPTQFVGFNQFYDDANMAEATNFAIALDGAFSARSNISFSYVTRDVDFPVNNLGVETWFEAEDNLAGIEYQLALADAVNGTLGYFHNDYELEEGELTLINDPVALTTKRVPLGLHFFWGDYLRFDVQSAYYDQEAALSVYDELVGEASLQRKRSNAWVSDLALVAKFPGRHGDFRLGVDNVTGEDVQILGSDIRTLMFYPARLAYAAVRFSF